jgi:4-amino-4-deoxy-L-arabinose transferase-like glycosyltransferase
MPQNAPPASPLEDPALAPARPAGPDWIDRLARGWRGYLVIALIALAATLPGVFSIGPLDRDEARFAQATAQMLETGDFVRIRFQDEARNKKPVGIHWLQAASVELLSNPGARAIWAYRVPSVLGALLAGLAALWAGSALLPRRTAFIGAALFAACVLVGAEGMIAKTDSVQCGLITLAMAALARLYAGKGDRRHVMAFWAALGLAILVKGPVGPLVVGLALGALYLVERKAAWMKALLFPPGPILCALIVLPWFVAVQQATGGAFLSEAVSGDLAPKIGGGHEGHFAPPGVHLLLSPLLSFPMILAWPLGLMAAWDFARPRKPDSGHPVAPTDQRKAALFLLAWAIPTWLLFELLPTKLAHYTLPAYPALGLLAGLGLMGDGDDRPLAKIIGQTLFVLAAALIFAAVAYYGAIYGGRPSMALYNAGALAALGGLLAARGIGMGRTVTLQHQVIWAIGLALIWHAATREMLLPRARDLRASETVSQALTDAGLHPRLSIGEPGPLVAAGYAEPSLVFLTRTDTVVRSTPAAAGAAAPGAGAVVEEKAMKEFLAILAARGLDLAPVATVRAYNYSRGDPVVLVVGKIVKPGEAAAATPLGGAIR